MILSTRQRAEFATCRRLIAAAVNEGFVTCWSSSTKCDVFITCSCDDALNDEDKLIWFKVVDGLSLKEETRIFCLDPQDIAYCIPIYRGNNLLHPATLFSILAQWTHLPESVSDRICLELENSVNNQEIAFNCQQVAEAPTLTSPAIEWEQAIVEGHPSHPLHRTKLGFENADVLRWTAEAHKGPDLYFVALPRSQINLVNNFEELLLPWLPEETRNAIPLENCVIPVHPHQWSVIQSIAPKAMLLPGRKASLAQTSVRTVSCPGFEYHLKLALAVHTTSALRTISPQSIFNGPLLTSLLKPIVPSALCVIGEPAAANFKHADSSIAKHLACLIREDPERILPGEKVIIVGALNEVYNGKPLVVTTFKLDTDHSKIDFLDRYSSVFLDCFIPPLRDYGVAFEAHGQNVLARFLPNGELVGFAVRDFGGLKIHLPTWEAATHTSLNLYPDSTITAATLREASTKLFHTGIQHHLHYLIRALGLHHNGLGWAVVRQHVQRLLANTDLLSWWFEPEVEFKRLLTMRMEDTPYDTLYSKTQNVLLVGQTDRQHAYEVADYEQTLLLIRECYVYKIPPRTTSKGFKAADWDLNGYVWQGRLRVVSLGEQLFIKLEDATSGELFAVCKYNKNDNSVEQVLDSSRYFVLRIENERGQHTFIGLGFLERTNAFDFNVTLQEFEKHLNAEKEAIKRMEEYEKQPKKDFSLREGQTISIKLGGVAKPTSRPATNTGSSGPSLLPAPPRAHSTPSSSYQPQAAQPARAAQPAKPASNSSPWGDFDDFQDATNNNTSANTGGSTAFTGWTTF